MKKRIGKISKKGQETLGISFGVIFSIILIVFFIIIAFIVIRSFLKVGDCAEMGIFVDKFNSDIKKTWNSQFDAHVFKGNLPSSLEYVCFANLSKSSRGEFELIGYDLGLFEGKNANMFFYPTSKACEMPYNNVPNLDLDEITRLKNPNCFPIQGGRININVEKGLNDRFVKIRV